MTITTQAAIVAAPSEPFDLREITLDGLRPDEVLVEVKAAGLCHTDLSVAGGHLPFPLPGVLGHEGAGIVSAVGSSVRSVAVGDTVVLSFTSCGLCANCRDGHPAYCTTWLPDNLLGGVRPDGSHTLTLNGQELGGRFFGQSSFARLAIVDERSAVKVDSSLPFEQLAPLACGIQTGAGAIWNAAPPRPGSSVAVFGAGAVGLAAVMAAALSPATRIIAVDLVPSRLDMAKRLGATDTVDASAVDDVPEAIQALTGEGADVVIEATGSTKVLEQALASSAPRARIVAVGAPPFGATAAVDVNFMMPGRTLQGITLGDSETRSLIPALARLAESGRFPAHELITTYAFEAINTAAENMKDGKTIKPVILM